MSPPLLPTRDGALDDLARGLVVGGVAPQAAVACAGWSPRSSRWRSAVGGATETLFDLASLTKPMTAVAVVQSRIARTRTLAELVPELAASASGDAPIELLLSHRAGLVPHVPLYQPLLLGLPVDVGVALRAAADGRRDDAKGPYPSDGFAPVYSDLGYVLAGVALARANGLPDAGEAIVRHVVAPLGRERDLGTARELRLGERPERQERDVAPTEVVAFRGGEIKGKVHDENAWALTGRGGSGHAGMFGTAEAVLSFGCAVLDGLGGQGPLAGEDLGWLVAPRPNGTLRAGFDGKSPDGSSAGTRFGPTSFGHLGFTGTSLWIDPDARVVAVLLTNRVSPTRAHDAIRAARPRVHDALHAFARALGDGDPPRGTE